MKRYGDLFDKVCSFENLMKAFRKAFRGTKNAEAEEFYFEAEKKILKLKQELENETYKPKEYKYFMIYDPKEREISVADFTDRVVHHAIVNILEPIYEKIFIYDSYATRKNKGTHRAILKAQRYMTNSWYLKFDIRKYFYNIEHNIMMKIISRKIKDTRLLRLIEKIIKNNKYEKGLPIGNLTSQFFANIYLDIFDHYIKDELGIKCYIRYMDDCVIFSNSKEELKILRKQSELFLEKNLNLELKQEATYINSSLNGLSFLGKRIYRNQIRIKRENLKRSIKKMKMRKREFEKGKISLQSYSQSIESIVGLMKNYNTMELRRKIFNEGQIL